ncbi:MAG: hypothetical protein HPY69_14310 [Armatimonadetes bacterium]|nr:hypothetical protein [Armatimonadota bacterium]
MPKPTLRAGAAAVDITPPLGTHLAGAVAAYRPAQSVLEPTFARALVAEAGNQRLCLVVLDVCIVTAEYSAPIRQAAAELLGCGPEAVLVCATQTHSAPALGHIMVDPDFPALPPEFEFVRGGEAAYYDWALPRAVEAVRLAAERVEPVELAVGSGIEGRFAFNRRAVRRDGQVAMPGRAWDNPLGPTWIRYLEGPMDPEVGVVAFRRLSGEPLAILVHHTCHPVHVFPRTIISPDWPGAVCDALQARYGQDCTPLVLNGACGNINPWPPFDPDYPDDHRLMGQALADMAMKVMDTVEYAGDVTIGAKSCHLPLAFRDLTAEELSWAGDILSRHPVPPWADEARTQVDYDWTVAASIHSVHLQQQRERKLSYEVQALRLGSAAIVGLPGEPFVEGQLAIKLGSPAYPTYVAHAATQYVGYIPTAAALQRGGHEVNTRYWAKLRPEALDMVVDGALGLLREVCMQ